MDSGLTKSTIDDYLQGGLDDDRCTTFNSSDELWTIFENFEFGVGFTKLALIQDQVQYSVDPEHAAMHPIVAQSPSL